MCDSVKKTNRLQLKITNHYETCQGNVERSNPSDWSIFHRRPERDHLETLRPSVAMATDLSFHFIYKLLHILENFLSIICSEVIHT